MYLALFSYDIELREAAILSGMATLILLVLTI